MNINNNILQQRLDLGDQAINQTYDNRAKIALDYRLIKRPSGILLLLNISLARLITSFAVLALT